jgi:hypothetical protein
VLPDVGVLFIVIDVGTWLKRLNAFGFVHHKGF